MIERIVSGGQTGVDRAALDAALAAGFPCGGWCPRGRRAEDGALDARYPLIETPGDSMIERTRANVADSDATLILCLGRAAGGTRDTLDCAAAAAKPALVIDLADGADGAEDAAAPALCERIVGWLDANRVAVLNVAGPRESEHPGIHRMAQTLVRDLIAAVRAGSV